MPAAFPKPPISAQRFRSSLLAWYDTNKRNLPWRQTRDPYRIWVSEIMLQQTRVAAVLEHYKAFIRRFPTVSTLANARVQQVLTAWSGLGYYRRARMLHSAAREVARDHSGRLPESSVELQQLPGIGRYTAAAIASIAFSESVAVVDGNVERVLSRVEGKQLSTASCWAKAQQLIDQERPGEFNQAMMELGATICLPRSPLCAGCPVRKHCSARGRLADGKPKSPQLRARRNLALITRKNAVLLQQRSRNESVMPGLWDLPDHSGSDLKPVLRVKHSIMNTDYDVQVFAETSSQVPKGEWISFSRLGSIPLTGMSRKVLRGLTLLQ